MRLALRSCPLLVASSSPPRRPFLRSWLAVSVVLFLALSSAAAYSIDWGALEETKLVPVDVVAGDWFGQSLALGDNTLVATALYDDAYGDDSGLAYAYERIGGVWMEVQQMSPLDAAAGQQFGTAAAISGDTLVIGAGRDDEVADDAGAAYVFEHQGGAWVQTAKLTGHDSATQDGFGNYVAIDGDTLVVGAPRHDAGASNTGAAYVFERTGGAWAATAKLVASDGGEGDGFGRASISGDLIAFGVGHKDAPAGTNVGAVYVFRRSGGAWTEEAKLVASDGADRDMFGHAIATDGNSIVAGAPSGRVGIYSGAGATYVFEQVGGVWQEFQKLTHGDPWSWDFFGSYIALDGGVTVIGAIGVDGVASGEGAIIAFESQAGVWTETATLVPSDVQALDYFGSAVAIHEGTIAGAAGYSSSKTGAVWVFAGPPADPETQLEALIEAVAALADEGVINHGNENALTKKLENALKSLGKGKPSPAINKVRAFINQVSAFMNAGKLTTEQGEALISAAQAIVDGLLGGG